MAKNKDFETSTGKGGETHQHVPKKGPHSKPDAHLTTNQGIRGVGTKSAHLSMRDIRLKRRQVR